MKKQYMYVIGAIIVVVIAIIIGLVASSLKQLNSDEMGIAYDTIQKKLSDNVEQEGLHTGPPGFEFIKFPSVFRTISFPDLQCLNKDGVTINLNVDFQYQARAADLKTIILEFQNHDIYYTVLERVGEAAIHEACSEYNTTEFQTIRALFQQTVRDTLSERFNEFHATVADLQVNNIARPQQYEEAIRQKEAARENIEVARNERPIEITQANTARREAETAATIAINRAESDARIIRTRADSESAAITKQYETEAETYKQIIDTQGLTVDEFMAYMGVRTIGSAKNPVYASVDAPAKTSYH
ncbi:uncharacterized protein LOC100367895 [Saccoglossus kowalevskii]|uniref:Uncharacterized protein LOC100367895 n=1 Tax=Saccoglossus kowalevskii TaxID=10224 RepID=A0ABM0GXB8_SACKO|nr:PREDICTED: uncharacterized protein LOC100367895 [Saccoglossus kowalevskii]